MAIARTGVFVDDYLEYSSSLPAELQRLLSTMRELDERSQCTVCVSLYRVLFFLRHIFLLIGYLLKAAMISQTKEQTNYCLSFPSQHSKKATPDQEELIDKLRKEIEANQENALSLCTEKVLLAQQAYDLVDSHLKRLDEDLNQFSEELKQEGKIAIDEPAILPASSMKKAFFLTPQGRRPEMRLDIDRERDRDIELMPPPGSTHKKKSMPAPVDGEDQPIDPNEPTYCICGQVSFGDMIACDNENCEGGEWFHYQCVGLSSETRFKGKWYCPSCKILQRRGLLDPPS